MRIIRLKKRSIYTFRYSFLQKKIYRKRLIRGLAKSNRDGRSRLAERFSLPFIVAGRESSTTPLLPFWNIEFAFRVLHNVIQLDWHTSKCKIKFQRSMMMMKMENYWIAITMQLKTWNLSCVFAAKQWEKQTRTFL